MYALVNGMFGHVIGRVKRSGKCTKKQKTYKKPEDLARAYCRLSYLQRLIIVPAVLNGDGTYDIVSFEFVEGL